MLVTFIGEIKRTNSFGTFEPGKKYDVSNEVGEQLLTVPTLFQSTDTKFKAKSAKTQVVEVPEEKEKPKYSGTVGKLSALATERGVNVRRGARKAEIIQLLEEDDKKADKEGQDPDGDGEGGNP